MTGAARVSSLPGMSDDQLTWENLMKGEATKDATSEDIRPAPVPPSFGESKTKRPSRARPAEPISSASEETLFSKLDWSRLDSGAPSLRPAPKAAPTAKADMSPRSAPVPETSAVATVARVKVSSTALGLRPQSEMAPAVRVAPGLPVAEPDEDEALAKPADSPQIISVYELNKQIRSLLEGKFPLLWVRGEISNFKAHTSGHFYFSLKDSKAQISGVMFRGFNQQLKFRPEDGMEVIVRCRVTVYEPRGNYQLFCEMMEPVGAGALQKAFEQLKAKLQAEGLFDQARKRPLPALPRHIAIVTSPTGAAIRDMLNVLGRRFKGARITVVPTKVQGEQAAPEICAAIALANRLPDVDVMIVGRGGGSIEDMWCFNDERVARAISACRVPVISAVGHEIDFTIADFVADLRAPTPSAAAELVVKNAADLQQKIETIRRSLRLAVQRRLQSLQQQALAFAKRLVVVDPQRRIQDCMQRCDELSQRMETVQLRRLQERRMRIALLREKLGHPEQRVRGEIQKISVLAQRLSLGWKTLHARKTTELEKHMALLDSLSPLRVVERGYSMVTLNEQVINDVAQVNVGDVVCVQFARGRASAAITRIENDKGVRVLDKEARE